MLRSETLFGKRDTPATPSTTPGAGTASGSALLQGASTGLPKMSTAADRAPVTSAVQPSAPDHSQASTNESGSKLIVGPNIKLKGVEISDCDTLVVEGRVEATIQIAEMGAFTGSAEVDLAEIRGDFEGELTVRQKLVIFGSGKVSGKIRYGKLVVEEGGQLSGDVQSGGMSPPRSLSVAKAVL